MLSYNIPALYQCFWGPPSHTCYIPHMKNDKASRDEEKRVDGMMMMSRGTIQKVERIDMSKVQIESIHRKLTYMH